MELNLYYSFEDTCIKAYKQVKSWRIQQKKSILYKVPGNFLDLSILYTQMRNPSRGKNVFLAQNSFAL